MPDPKRILVVDDEPQIRRIMRTTLTSTGYEVDDVKTGEEALEKVRTNLSKSGHALPDTLKQIDNQFTALKATGKDVSGFDPNHVVSSE